MDILSNGVTITALIKLTDKNIKDNDEIPRETYFAMIRKLRKLGYGVGYNGRVVRLDSLTR